MQILFTRLHFLYCLKISAWRHKSFVLSKLSVKNMSSKLRIRGNVTLTVLGFAGDPLNKSQMNMTPPRFGCDDVALPKYIELGGDAVNGVFYMTYYISATTANIAAAQTFIGKIKKAYGRVVDAYLAEAYDAITMALPMIERAGSENKAAIRNALSKTNFESVPRPVQVRRKRRSAAADPRRQNRQRQGNKWSRHSYPRIARNPETLHAPDSKFVQ